MPSVKSDESAQNILTVNRTVFPHKTRRVNLTAIGSGTWILHFVHIFEI